MIIAAVGIIMTYRPGDTGEDRVDIGDFGDVIADPRAARVTALSACRRATSGKVPGVTTSPTSPKSTRYDTRSIVMGVICPPRRYSPFNDVPFRQ